MRRKEIFNTIREEFCSLFHFKLHGDHTLEVITPIPTITNKFVSVFITVRKNKLIATDGGWISMEMYDHSIHNEDAEIASRVINQFERYYEMSQTEQAGIVYYFKSIEKNKKELLPNVVFEVANFVASAVGSYELSYREKKEKEQRDHFRSETNDFFQGKYGEIFRKNDSLVGGVKHNGIIRHLSHIVVIEYVSGHNETYFEQDMRKAILNHTLVEEYGLSEYDRKKLIKTTVVNKVARGYIDPNSEGNLLGELLTNRSQITNNEEKGDFFDKLLRSISLN